MTDAERIAEAFGRDRYGVAWDDWVCESSMDEDAEEASCVPAVPREFQTPSASEEDVVGR